MYRDYCRVFFKGDARNLDYSSNCGSYRKRLSSRFSFLGSFRRFMEFWLRVSGFAINGRV